MRAHPPNVRPPEWIAPPEIARLPPQSADSGSSEDYRRPSSPKIRGAARDGHGCLAPCSPVPAFHQHGQAIDQGRAVVQQWSSSNDDTQVSGLLVHDHVQVIKDLYLVGHETKRAEDYLADAPLSQLKNHFIY